MPATRSYSTVVTTGDRKRVMVPVPFDPDTVWGRKPEHRVHGTVNGMSVRASIESSGEGFAIVLGPAWRRDCGIGEGDAVDVVLAPEGPQRDDLADDVRAALEAEPAAGAFFDGLAQFYRRAFLRWIDATKRRPEERERRIAEMVDLLRRGEKERAVSRDATTPPRAADDRVVQVLPARLDWLEALQAGDDVFTSRFDIAVVDGWVGFPEALPTQSPAPASGRKMNGARTSSSTSTGHSSGSAGSRANRSTARSNSAMRSLLHVGAAASPRPS